MTDWRQAALDDLSDKMPRVRAVEELLTGSLVREDTDLDDALQATRSAGLPEYEVSPLEGKLLNLLARAVGAKRILEVGTLGGYSTLWLAKALPADGELVTLELHQERADVARQNLERAGFADRVDVLVGPATDSLATLRRTRGREFDFAFVDADKDNDVNYAQACLALCRPGALIVVDNMIRFGNVLDPGATPDPGAPGTRKLIDHLATEQRLDATALQTVSARGWDGPALLLVRE
jgi:predicted O-methyltransferase YrrM